MSFTKNPSKRAVSGSMTNKIPSSQEMKHYDNCCGIHGAARLRKGMKHATVTERRRHEKDIINEQLAQLSEEKNMSDIDEDVMNHSFGGRKISFLMVQHWDIGYPVIVVCMNYFSLKNCTVLGVIEFRRINCPITNSRLVSREMMDHVVKHVKQYQT